MKAAGMVVMVRPVPGPPPLLPRGMSESAAPHQAICLPVLTPVTLEPEFPVIALPSIDCLFPRV